MHDAFMHVLCFMLMHFDAMVKRVTGVQGSFIVILHYFLMPRQEIKNFCGSLSRRNLFFCVFTEASFSSRLFFLSNDDLDDSIDLLFKACHKYNKSNGLICGCHHLVKSFCIKNEPI